MPYRQVVLEWRVKIFCSPGYTMIVDPGKEFYVNLDEIIPHREVGPGEYCMAYIPELNNSPRLNIVVEGMVKISHIHFSPWKRVIKALLPKFKTGQRYNAHR